MCAQVPATCAMLGKMRALSAFVSSAAMLLAAGALLLLCFFFFTCVSFCTSQQPCAGQLVQCSTHLMRPHLPRFHSILHRMLSDDDMDTGNGSAGCKRTLGGYPILAPRRHCWSVWRLAVRLRLQLWLRLQLRLRQQLWH